MTRMLLIMRNTYGWNGDHIEAMLRLGVEIHLATQVPSDQDSRFATVTYLEPEMDLDSAVTHLVDAARSLGIGTAVTFYEADLILTAMVNAKLGDHPWVNLAADTISRDKRLQREFLARHGIPSPRSAPVSAEDPVGSGLAAAADFTFPMIVKPTYLSASIGVSLVRDEADLRAMLTEIADLAGAWESYFLADRLRPIALIEEFLPGKEVTVDGVTLFGRFHLAGVTNKMQMPGPYFEEDYYTLPFRTPAEEPELVELVQAIVDGLGVQHCLFNAEFRKDAAGVYHVVEFSTRLSGGQNYRCLRDVYAIDPVRLYLKAILAGVDPALEDQVWAGELRRQPARMATCIKYVYRSGVLMRNNTGEVMHSPYFRDYLIAAKPGAVLRKPPEGWYEFAGSLAIAAPYRDVTDLDRIERIADDLDSRLDIVVV